MKQRNTQFAADAALPDEPEPIHGNGAAPAEPEPSDDAPPAPEPVAVTEAPAVAPPAADAAPPDLPVASALPPVAPLLGAPIEERIGRLEAEIARLHAAQAGESRVAALPVAQAIRLEAAPPQAAAEVVRPPRRFWADLGRRLTAPSAPAASPPRHDALASMIPPGVRRGWLVLDSLTELRAMYWMFFDPRYRLSWLSRLAPLALVCLIATSYYWAPATSLPVVGVVIEKVVDLALAYVLFKLLSHEARRYRETAPDLPPSLRL